MKDSVSFLSGTILGLLVGAAILGMVVLTSGCAVSSEPLQSVGEAPAMVALPLPIVHDCSSRSSLEVGNYAGQWANWRLTVDASGFAYAVVTTDGGVTVEAHGGMPLTIHLPNDVVDFKLGITAPGWAGLTQPFPGLSKGFTVEVRCAK